ncbi:hypothetical protein IH824_10785 [candidate division KSB1 bacterium]|nr:hypothetical protein [candidate division KSB1 bacterium]
MRNLTKLLIIIIFLVGSTSVFGQGKIKGYMFGDYYYVLKNHDSSIEGSNGFWFRRIYLTYDHTLDDEFSVRLRLEMNSPGDFSTRSKLEPFLKDAYLKWTRANHAIILGLSSTPTWNHLESVWGYRSVEKTPGDLYKWDSSRDFGIAFKGSLGSEKRVNYHLMFANGGGTRSETNKGKKLRLALGYNLTSNITVEAFGDWEERPGNSNRYSAQGVATYHSKSVRLGAQLYHQTRKSDTGDLDLELLSLFGAAKLSEKVWGFARWDRAFDPLPDGPGISYLPIDGTAQFNFLLLGIDIMPHKQVHFMPNVELVFYGDKNGSSPDSDVIPRFTFYYVWK